MVAKGGKGVGERGRGRGTQKIAERTEKYMIQNIHGAIARNRTRTSPGWMNDDLYRIRIRERNVARQDKKMKQEKGEGEEK